jgi:hypothetical protein
MSERDAPVLREIRDVLLRHGAINRFGVTLLHKHFELRDGEQLVEYIQPENRTLISKPIVGLDEGRSTETAWRFAADGEGAAATLVCFSRCRIKDGSAEHSGIIDHVK